MRRIAVCFDGTWTKSESRLVSNVVKIAQAIRSLTRVLAAWTRGFHNTYIGENVQIGLHAVGVDECRRPFAPTFWTIQKGKEPAGHVEQVGFAVLIPTSAGAILIPAWQTYH